MKIFFLSLILTFSNSSYSQDAFENYYGTGVPNTAPLGYDTDFIDRFNNRNYRTPNVIPNSSWYSLETESKAPSLVDLYNRIHNPYLRIDNKNLTIKDGSHLDYDPSLAEPIDSFDTLKENDFGLLDYDPYKGYFINPLKTDPNDLGNLNGTENPFAKFKIEPENLSDSVFRPSIFDHLSEDQILIFCLNYKSIARQFEEINEEIKESADNTAWKFVGKENEDGENKSWADVIDYLDTITTPEAEDFVEKWGDRFALYAEESGSSLTPKDSDDAETLWDKRLLLLYEDMDRHLMGCP